MTKEQEKIIYRLNSDIDSPLSGGYTTIVLIDDLEAILNMLKGRDREVEKLRKHNKDLLRKLRNRVKEVKKVTKNPNYKSIVTKQGKTLEESAQEIKKKDKMIDLMAEELKKHIFVLYDGDTITSKKGIIEHYERKATNDG